MIKLLGPEWGLILTDVTRGDAGNGERLAFLFDQRKVQLSGLAAELVVPKEQIEENKIQPDALQEQFARTPYAVSFRCNDKTFILVTLHVLYGKKAAQRTPELAAIARWMAGWAADVNAWDHNLIALGDFNIDRKDDPRYQAFMSTGLQAPEDLNRVPRSIFADPDTPQLEKFYDQIAWFTGEGGVPELSLDYVKGGNFDFVPHVLTSRGLTKNQLSYRMSDHYPLWVEFAVRR
jgi:endonuclease/exonuclease/phosphatase family metal-dependent hydrolase